MDGSHCTYNNSFTILQIWQKQKIMPKKYTRHTVSRLKLQVVWLKHTAGVPTSPCEVPQEFEPWTLWVDRMCYLLRKSGKTRDSTCRRWGTNQPALLTVYLPVSTWIKPSCCCECDISFISDRAEKNLKKKNYINCS